MVSRIHKRKNIMVVIHRFSGHYFLSYSLKLYLIDCLLLFANYTDSWIIILRLFSCHRKEISFKLIFQFLTVWADTLHDNRTLYSQSSYVFGFSKLTVFGENDLIRLTAKNNYQLMHNRLEILKEYSENNLNVTWKSLWKPHLVAKIWHSKDHQISKNSNKMAEYTKFTAL